MHILSNVSPYTYAFALPGGVSFDSVSGYGAPSVSMDDQEGPKQAKQASEARFEVTSARDERVRVSGRLAEDEAMEYVFPVGVLVQDDKPSAGCSTVSSFLGV